MNNDRNSAKKCLPSTNAPAACSVGTYPGLPQSPQQPMCNLVEVFSAFVLEVRPRHFTRNFHTHAGQEDVYSGLRTPWQSLLRLSPFNAEDLTVPRVGDLRLQSCLEVLQQNKHFSKTKCITTLQTRLICSPWCSENSIHHITKAQKILSLSRWDKLSYPKKIRNNCLIRWDTNEPSKFVETLVLPKHSETFSVKSCTH